MESKAMTKDQLVGDGDRLIAIYLSDGPPTYKAGQGKCLSIGVYELPGPMGNYLVANVIFEDARPDFIAPLHSLAAFEVLNP